MAFSAGLAVVTVLACFVATAQCIRVSTAAGEFIGFDETWGGKTVHKFYGIPFAEPPIGDLRFARPVPKAPLEEPFQATKIGDFCLQGRVMLDLFSPDTEWVNYTLSENCLNLNIYVPAGGEAKKAVMVFVHGGGFVAGSGMTFDGTKMAALGDTIVVTINYRLGIFGFFTTDDEVVQGNQGLMDQQLAFKWVQQNIGAFGGDTNRVTIFGESAGAASVTWHMLVPSNEGLFQRVIAESGTGLAAWALPKDKVVKRYTELLLKKMNCTGDSAAAVACLRKTPVDRFDADVMGWPFAEVMPLAGEVLGGPRVDGDFIPYSPASRVPKERMEDQPFYRNLDFIIGANKYEGSPILAFLFEQMYKAQTNLSLYDGVPKPFFETTAKNLAGFENDASVEALWWLYGRADAGTSDMMEPRKFLDFMGDSMFYDGTNKFLKRRVMEPFERQGSTYQYSFLPAPSKEVGGLIFAMGVEPWIDGAIHGDDLYYLGGNATFERNRNKISKEEIDLSDSMITYWTNFAKTGNPNQPSPVQFEWPKFAKGTEEFIEFDIKDKQVDLRSNSFYRHRYLSFWNDVIPLIENSGQESTVDEAPKDTPSPVKDEL